MTTLGEYLDRYNDEIDMYSHMVLIRLKESQFQIVMEASRYICGYGDGDEELEPGVRCYLILTDVGIADVDKARVRFWWSPGLRFKLPLDVPAVKYSSVQMHAEDQWMSLVVLELGGFCVWMRPKVKNRDRVVGA